MRVFCGLPRRTKPCSERTISEPWKVLNPKLQHAKRKNGELITNQYCIRNYWSQSAMTFIFTTIVYIEKHVRGVALFSTWNNPLRRAQFRILAISPFWNMDQKCIGSIRLNLNTFGRPRARSWSWTSACRAKKLIFNSDSVKRCRKYNVTKHWYSVSLCLNSSSLSFDRLSERIISSVG